MSNRKFYICYLIMRDEDTRDLVGSVKAMLANDETEVLNSMLASIQEAEPNATLSQQAADVREITPDLLEQAATEILGWKKPEENQSNG